MAHEFKIGDWVEFNGDGGRSTGVITEKVTSEIMFKGYVRHASPKEPQYIIKIDHLLAMQKGSSLRKVKKPKLQIGIG